LPLLSRVHTKDRGFECRSFARASNPNAGRRSARKLRRSRDRDWERKPDRTLGEINRCLQTPSVHKNMEHLRRTSPLSSRRRMCRLWPIQFRDCRVPFQNSNRPKTLLFPTSQKDRVKRRIPRPFHLNAIRDFRRPVREHRKMLGRIPRPFHLNAIRDFRRPVRERRKMPERHGSLFRE
jgi:hypothetical protein